MPHVKLADCIDRRTARLLTTCADCGGCLDVLLRVHRPSPRNGLVAVEVRAEPAEHTCRP